MEVFQLWLKAAIAIAVISTISCQRIRQSNEHSTTLNRTKQNNNNRALDTDVDSSNSRLKTNHDTDSGGGGGDGDTDDDDHNRGDFHEPATTSNDPNQPHSRKKRLIWITDDGRLALPPGTVLSITYE